MFRLRERSRPALTMQTVGSFYTYSTLTGDSVPGAPAQALVGNGVKEKCMDELHAGPPYNTGGPFFLARVTLPHYVVGHVHTRGGPAVGGAGLNSVLKELKRALLPGETFRRAYAGGLVLSPPILGSLPSENISGPDDYYSGVNDNDLQTLGNRAYNRLRPKPETMNLAQTLVELREVPRMIRPLAGDHARAWRNIVNDVRSQRDLSGAYRARGRERLVARMAPRRAADQFLAVQFGWRPFVGDMVSLLDSTINLDNNLQRAVDRNGRWQQRRFAEDELRSSTKIWSQTNAGTATWTEPSLSSYAARATLTIYREGMTRIWYKGSFKYYYPEFERIPPSQLGALVMAQRALRLYGLRVSPTLIYRVTPWTWLVDWFVNVGGNLQVLEDMSTGSVASRYMYLMRESYDRYRYVLDLELNDGQKCSFEAIREVRVKRRAPAETHFGFSAAPGGLSPMQQAIIAALGLSRT